MNSSVKDDSVVEGSPATNAVLHDAQAKAPLVRVSGLAKRYNKVVALDHIDLTIYEGEFLVLLGPSGCGKTTTMRCIAGLEEPSDGLISLGGKTFYDAKKGIDVAPNKRGIGMVFQSYALWPHKSVLQNVVFPLRMQKVSRRQAAAQALEAIAMVGLAGYADRSITTLSGGQMQRVALARAVVGQPRVLLLDEPLSNLDAKLRLRLRHELKEFQHSIGVTTVMVTHDQSEALGLADRIVVMDHGRVVQIGTPKELYANPKDPFVADFLGMTNRVPVALSKTSGGSATGEIKGTSTGEIQGTSTRVVGVDRRTNVSAAEAILCFRPGAARIIPVEGAQAAESDNQWHGTIISTQFQGVGHQVRMALADGTVVDSQDHGAHEFQPGEKCFLVVAAHDCFIFDDEAE